jgi:uncharacterized metal-binding protein YceD (DUF177 family)
MRAAEGKWTLLVRPHDVPETGRRFELSADEATRAATARAAKVEAIERLQAVFEVSRRGRHGLHVIGNVSATVRQACVVTLEPVESEIHEAIDAVFDPSAERSAGAAQDHEIAVDAPEPPEPLIDGAVDLGALATEFLILGIDPYPRKPGAVFEAPLDADAGPNPFAALAGLRKGEG